MPLVADVSLGFSPAQSGRNTSAARAPSPVQLPRVRAALSCAFSLARAQQVGLHVGRSHASSHQAATPARPPTHASYARLIVVVALPFAAAVVHHAESPALQCTMQLSRKPPCCGAARKPEADSAAEKSWLYARAATCEELGIADHGPMGAGSLRGKQAGCERSAGK